MRLFLYSCALCLGVLRAQQAPSDFFSVPKADAPQLAPQGHYAVGVRTLDLLHAGQIDILNLNKDTGKAPLYDRPLKVEVWYPAILAAGQEQRVCIQVPCRVWGRAPPGQRIRHSR